MQMFIVATFNVVLMSGNLFTMVIKTYVNSS